MKKLAIITACLFTFSSGEVYSQQSNISRAREAENRFSALVSDVRDIDKLIKSQFYVNTEQAGFKVNSNRLLRIQSAISELEEIEAIFKNLSEEQKTEKDYYIKLGYIDVLALNIFSRRNEFLDFLNISYHANAQTNKNEKDEYLRKMTEWEEKEQLHLNLVKKRIKLIRNYDPDNFDAEILTVLSSVFEKQNNEVVPKTLELLSQVRNKKFDNNTEDFSSENKICLLSTWLAYTYFTKGDQPNFEKTLKSVLAYNEPAESVFWTQECLKKLDYEKKNGVELRVPAVEFPRSKNVTDYKTLTVDYPVKRKKGPVVNLESNSKSISHNPRQLAYDLNNAWEGLYRMEQLPWDSANAEGIASVENKKPLYGKKKVVYVLPDEKNRGFKRRNKEKMLIQLQLAVELKSKFEQNYEGWQALAKSNPDNIYYRISKIKSALALDYLVANAKNYSLILDYYKVKGNVIFSSKKAEVKNLFSGNWSSEVDADVALIQKVAPTNIYFLLTKAEVAMFQYPPSEALEMIDKISGEIPPNAMLSNVDPLSTLEMYRSYCHFKNKDLVNLGKSLELLKTMEVSKAWVSGLVKRYNTLQLENQYLVK